MTAEEGFVVAVVVTVWARTVVEVRAGAVVVVDPAFRAWEFEI